MKGINVSKKRGLKKIVIGIALMGAGVGMMLLGDITHEKNTTPASESSVAPKYRTIQPVETNAHVVEFFWYGCPHCLKLEYALSRQGFADDIDKIVLSDGNRPVRKKIPAVMSPLWELHARLFYALDQAGMSEDGHLDVMQMINAEMPSSLDDVMEGLASGIVERESSRNQNFTSDLQKIERAMFSPETDSEINKSLSLSRAAGLKGVPTVLVGGDKLVELGRGVDYESVGPEVISILKGE